MLRSLLKFTGAFAASAIFCTNPSITEAVDFGEGAVVLPDDQGVRFRVYAPNANTVAVAGDFNSWSRTQNPLVKAGDYWETTVSSARPGQEYKYVVNGNLWRQDPWSFQVVESGDGNSVIVDLEAYEWSEESDNFQTPRTEDVVIYQLHLRSFLYNGDGLNYEPGNVFNQFVDHKLDYLEDLGVNTIHIMPIHEFPGDNSWGYNPVHFHAIESSYGTPQDFQRLVDECHQRGIAVILGIVYNHTDFGDNQHFWDFDGNAGDSIFGGNGDFYFPDERSRTPWGPEPDWSKPRVRERFIENIQMYAEYYRIDGIRMDAVGFIRNESWDSEYDWFGFPDEAGWSFLRDWNNVARSYENGAFMSIAEDIASNPDITKNASEGGAGFLSQWTETDLRWYASTPNDAERSMDGIARILGHFYPVNYGFHELVKYHTSHDKVGDLNQGLYLPSLIGDPEAWYARARTKVANSIIMYSAGTPLFFMGDEMYETGTWESSIGNGLDWTLLDKNPDIYEFNRDLIKLKLDAVALAQNNLEIPHINNAENLISWRRWGNNGEVVQFAVNFSASEKSFWINLPYDGEWHTVINSEWSFYGGSDETNRFSQNVSNGWAEYVMPPYSFIAVSPSLELAPGRVWDTTPEKSGSTDQTDLTLSWGASARADSYQVYFGSSEEAVANATPDSEQYLGATSDLEIPVDGLSRGAAYYWRVDSINSIGTTTGSAQRFRVVEPDTASAGRLSWSPSEPAPGEPLTITYDTYEGVLDGSTSVTAHLGLTVNGEQWSGVEQFPMTAAGGGQFQLTLTPPADAEAVNVVFFNENEVWDNNNQQDWRIDLMIQGELQILEGFRVY